MKGLLRKELYTVWAYCKVFVVVVIAFICIGPCNRGVVVFDVLSHAVRRNDPDVAARI